MKYKNATIDKAYKSDELIIKYIVLVLKVRKDINNFLDMKLHKYIGFKFDFKPY